METCEGCKKQIPEHEARARIHKYHFHGECLVEYLKTLNEARRKQAELDKVVVP